MVTAPTEGQRRRAARWAWEVAQGEAVLRRGGWKESLGGMFYLYIYLCVILYVCIYLCKMFCVGSFVVVVNDGCVTVVVIQKLITQVGNQIRYRIYRHVRTYTHTYYPTFKLEDGPSRLSEAEVKQEISSQKSTEYLRQEVSPPVSYTHVRKKMIEKEKQTRIKKRKKISHSRQIKQTKR